MARPGSPARSAITYFHAQGLSRDRFILSVGLMFLTFAAVQIPMLGLTGILRADTVLTGVIGLPAVAAGLWIGNIARAPHRTEGLRLAGADRSDMDGGGSRLAIRLGVCRRLTRSPARHRSAPSPTPSPSTICRRQRSAIFSSWVEIRKVVPSSRLISAIRSITCIADSAVEIAGGLIRQHQLGPVHQGGAPPPRAASGRPTAWPWGSRSAPPDPSAPEASRPPAHGPPRSRAPRGRQWGRSRSPAR